MSELGSGIGRGIKLYQDKKQEKELIDSTVATIQQKAASNPQVASALGLADVKDTKAIAAGIKALGGGDAKVGAQAAQRQLAQLGQAEEQQKVQQYDMETVGIGMRALQGGRDWLSDVKDRRLSPEIVKTMSGLEAQKQEMDLQAAQAQKARADAIAALREKPEKAPDQSFQEQAFAAEVAAQQQKLGRELLPAERAAIYQGILRGASPTGDPQETARIGLLTKDLETLGPRADTAIRMMPTLKSLSSKMANGLKTGKLEQFKTDAVAVARSLGIPVDEAKLGSAESASAQFGQFLLEAFQQTKGAITERENVLLAAMGPQFSKSNKANEDLLALVNERLALDIKLGDIYRNGLSAGDSLQAINAARQKATADFNKKYETQLASLESQYVAVPDGVTPAQWALMTDDEKALFKK